ncbi:hypothetical protein [Streptomyces sp. GF20]|uniref:hypothetical protein n=1 Tax=Streptomyces sp. GF20 TaxID=2692235 RepID=UPI001F170A21|nr:hypothetical protein [Streptomyces sp. GF20]
MHEIPAGEVSAILLMPTIRVQGSEPVKYTRLQLTDEAAQPLGAPFEGTVRDTV